MPETVINWFQANHWWGQVLVTAGAALVLLGAVGLSVTRKGDMGGEPDAPRSD